MNKRRNSGGSGCGWFIGLVAMGAAIGSLYVSGSVSVGKLTGGAIGMPADSHGVAGLLIVVALVGYGLARGQET